MKDPIEKLKEYERRIERMWKIPEDTNPHREFVFGTYSKLTELVI